MKEAVKEFKKKVGKKIYGDIKNLFQTKSKFYKFIKRHKNAPKLFFEEKLTPPKAKDAEKKEVKAETKKEEVKAEAPATEEKKEEKKEEQKEDKKAEEEKPKEE